MSDAVLITIMAVTIACVLFGLFAPRPKFRVSDNFLEQWVIGSVVLIGLGLMMWLLGSLDLAVIGLSAGLNGVFIAVWFATPRDDRGWGRGGGGRGGGGRGPDDSPLGPGPIDWEEFQRNLRSWSSRRSNASRRNRVQLIWSRHAEGENHRLGGAWQRRP